MLTTKHNVKRNPRPFFRITSFASLYVSNSNEGQSFCPHWNICSIMFTYTIEIIGFFRKTTPCTFITTNSRGNFDVFVIWKKENKCLTIKYLRSLILLTLYYYTELFRTHFLNLHWIILISVVSNWKLNKIHPQAMLQFLLL